MACVVTVASLLDRRSDGLGALSGAVVVALALSPPNAFDLGFQLSVLAVGGLLVFSRLTETWVCGAHPPGRRRARRARRDDARRSSGYDTDHGEHLRHTLARVTAREPDSGAARLCGTHPRAGRTGVPRPHPARRAESSWCSPGPPARLRRGARTSSRCCPQPLCPSPGQWVLRPRSCLRARRRCGPYGLVRARCERGCSVSRVLAIMLPVVWGSPPPSGARIVVLDVGQGDAILVQDGTSELLVDAGPDPGALKRGLLEQGVRTPDAVLVTHSHADHAAGLEALGTNRAVDLGFCAAMRDPPSALAVPELGAAARKVRDGRCRRHAARRSLHRARRVARRTGRRRWRQ